MLINDCVILQTGNDGFVIDPDGKSFMGKLGTDLKLCGKVRIIIIIPLVQQGLKVRGQGISATMCCKTRTFSTKGTFITSTWYA